jgi:hypothetical protein
MRVVDMSDPCLKRLRDSELAAACSLDSVDLSRARHNDQPLNGISPQWRATATA